MGWAKRSPARAATRRRCSSGTPAPIRACRPPATRRPAPARTGSAPLEASLVDAVNASLVDAVNASPQSSRQAVLTMPVPGNRSVSSSPGCIPRHRNNQAQNASGFRPISVPPRRAGCALIQSRTPGCSSRPGQMITASQSECMPRVCRLTPPGFVQAPTRTPSGQSGKSARSELDDVESAHPSYEVLSDAISAAWSTSPA